MSDAASQLLPGYSQMSASLAASKKAVKLVMAPHASGFPMAAFSGAHSHTEAQKLLRKSRALTAEVDKLSSRLADGVAVVVGAAAGVEVAVPV